MGGSILDLTVCKLRIRYQDLLKNVGWALANSCQAKENGSPLHHAQRGGEGRVRGLKNSSRK